MIEDKIYWIIKIWGSLVSWKFYLNLIRLGGIIIVGDCVWVILFRWFFIDNFWIGYLDLCVVWNVNKKNYINSWFGNIFF